MSNSYSGIPFTAVPDAQGNIALPDRQAPVSESQTRLNTKIAVDGAHWPTLETKRGTTAELVYEGQTYPTTTLRDLTNARMNITTGLVEVDAEFIC
jgi:hypothetical protein